MKTITIEKDGWVSLDERGLGDIDVNVEIVDHRKPYIPGLVLIILTMQVSAVVIFLISKDSFYLDAIGVVVAIVWGGFTSNVRLNK